MIEQNQVYAVEFNNFRRKHVNRGGNEIFLIEQEISEDDWHHLGAFPTDAIGTVGLQWTDRAAVPEKPKREPKPPKEPTPYGKFWQAMDKAGFHNRPDVRDWLGAQSSTEEAAKRLLRLAFGAESRATFVSPEDVEEWLRCQPNSGSAITMVRKIWVEAT